MAHALLSPGGKILARDHLSGDTAEHGPERPAQRRAGHGARGRTSCGTEAGARGMRSRLARDGIAVVTNGLPQDLDRSFHDALLRRSSVGRRPGVDEPGLAHGRTLDLPCGLEPGLDESRLFAGERPQEIREVIRVHSLLPEDPLEQPAGRRIGFAHVGDQLLL